MSSGPEDEPVPRGPAPQGPAPQGPAPQGAAPQGPAPQGATRRRESASRKGRLGEDAACRFLADSGWTLIGRNFRTKRGEIDIIAAKPDLIAFCEVKSWEYCPFADLERAIDGRKRERIVETSKIFLDQHREYKGAHIRYDVIFVTGEGASIRHFESAFTE